MNEKRIERDSMGAIEVSNQHLWGSQTQRSLMQFHISTEKMPEEFILALARVKQACVLANMKLGLLSPAKAKALLLAIDEIMRGEHLQEFPLSVWQTGSATQTNMNMNEVLANRATQIMGGVLGVDRYIHPNDDVNLGQSSNDVIPTAMHLASIYGLNKSLIPALDDLIAVLQKKVKAFSKIIKVGRTHLQDAVPLTLGQEFSGYVAQLKIAQNAILLSMPGISELAIGGTAVGTGINAHPKFAENVIAKLNEEAGFDFINASNKFAAIAGHEPIVFTHGALKVLATALMKLSTDIRWMASGPRCGLGEISIPENEPGSSIMPGKVNPTQCEALAMICYQVLGNDLTVSLGAASGNFELNVFKPLILHNFLQSIRLLSDGMRSFNQYCVQGIEPNIARITELSNASLMLATALVPHIGYENAASIAKTAHEENISFRQAALTSGFVSENDFSKWIEHKKMI